MTYRALFTEARSRRIELSSTSGVADANPILEVSSWQGVFFPLDPLRFTPCPNKAALHLTIRVWRRKRTLWLPKVACCGSLHKTPSTEMESFSLSESEKKANLKL